MKIVQYDESATWKKYNVEIVQHKKKCNMKRLLHKKVQHRNDSS